MTTLLAIRHGRTPANAEGILAGRLAGVTLDSVGVESTQALAARLVTVPVSQVVVSPLERTVQTGQLLFSGHDSIAHDDRLIECDYGDWQGRKLEDLAKEELWSVVQNQPHEMHFPNGESMQNMFNRSVECVREWNNVVAQKFGDNAIWAVVSHGDIIKAICADAMGLPLERFQSLMIDPSSVSVIHFGEKTGLAKLNDTGEHWLSQLRERTEEPRLGGQSGKVSE